MPAYGYGAYGSGSYGNVTLTGEPLTPIVWGEPKDRTFETGLDRGVLYLNDNSSVPWNGLVSVVENGAEEIVPYYMDGRPFLYRPKPKEYSATIDAYTYPDAFAELMGYAEIADGMFLDSQQSDTFGLSYRTRVGSALDVESSYKIHLVYNAVVMPPSSSYESIGSEINPSTFSWEIAAVPRSILNHRPTAHVVINTKNVEPSRMTELESLLYSGGAIPDLDEIYDIMRFDNNVEFTDNGDGTWTAQGSYKQVRMLSDDVFELRDINAVVYESGTYVINPDATTSGLLTEPLGPAI